MEIPETCIIVTSLLLWILASQGARIWYINVSGQGKIEEEAILVSGDSSLLLPLPWLGFTRPVKSEGSCAETLSSEVLWVSQEDWPMTPQMPSLFFSRDMLAFHGPPHFLLLWSNHASSYFFSFSNSGCRRHYGLLFNCSSAPPPHCLYNQDVRDACSPFIPMCSHWQHSVHCLLSCQKTGGVHWKL